MVHGWLTNMRVRVTLEFNIPEEGFAAEAWNMGGSKFGQVAQNVRWCLEHENTGIAEYEGIDIIRVQEIPSNK
jgi:hypothetical protein